MHCTSTLDTLVGDRCVVNPQHPPGRLHDRDDASSDRVRWSCPRGRHGGGRIRRQAMVPNSTEGAVAEYMALESGTNQSPIR